MKKWQVRYPPLLPHPIKRELNVDGGVLRRLWRSASGLYRDNSSAHKHGALKITDRLKGLIGAYQEEAEAYGAD